MTEVVALGIHVTMLQVLRVPFPDRTLVSPWAMLANTFLAVLALMTLHDWARGSLAACRWWTRWLAVAALFGMLKEAFRASIMSAVVTTAWAYDAAQAMGPITYSVVLGGLVVLVAPHTRGPWARAIAAMGIATAMSFVVRPASAALLSPLMRSIAALDHPEVYPFPYGWHVLSWA